MKKFWNSISLIGHAKLNDPADLRQLTLLNRISSIGTLNLTGLIFISIYFRLPVVTAYVCAGALLCCFTFILNARGLFKQGRIYFIIVTWAFVASNLVFLSGRDGGTQIVFTVLPLLPLVLFRQPKWIFPAFFAIVILLAYTSYWAETHIVILDTYTYWLKRFSFYINVLSTMILVFAIVLYYRNTAFEFERTITLQNVKITQKNKDITDSITYAKRLQSAILPPDRLIKEYLPDSFVLYKPKDIVAGDFYWIEKTDDLVIFAAADCTGHGVPGAIVSVVCNNALNRSLREFKLRDPGSLLDKTRELVIEQFEKSDDEVKDGMDISLCCLNKNTNQLTWAGANNPLWIIHKKELKEIKPNKQPIGTHTESKPFTTHTVQLQKGDCIYIFTDGYADQFGGERCKKFKTSALKEMLLNIIEKTMAAQQDHLDRSFEAWKKNTEQVDDVCIIGVRI